MKKIGAGLQFNVYDLGNGRVLRKPKKEFFQYLTYLKWSPQLIFQPKRFSNLIKQANQDREFAINYFKKNKSAFDLIGNPNFNLEEITQHKVIPFRKLFGKSYSEDKKLIDKYILFTFECWKNGFADRIYNLDNNFGIDKNDKVILMDFFEITTEKEKIKEAIKIELWKKSAFYRYRLQRKSKNYYSEKMKKNLTLENLNKYWRKNEN